VTKVKKIVAGDDLPGIKLEGRTIGNPHCILERTDKQLGSIGSLVFTTKSDIETITKTPKCTVKLLGKPPFAFLFDVIRAFTDKTGFAKVGVTV
jgi:hypothetical protein